MLSYLLLEVGIAATVAAAEPPHTVAFSSDTQSCDAVTVEIRAHPEVAKAGELVQLEAIGVPETGDAVLRWDVDGDGIVDRTGSNLQLEATYPVHGSLTPGLMVEYGDGCSAAVSTLLDIRGPRLDPIHSSKQSATELCGDGDDLFEPGERWEALVGLVNNGGAALAAGGALVFAPSQSVGDRVVIEQSAIAVPHVAVDGFASIWVPFRVADHATCGESISFDYLGAVTDEVSSPFMPEPVFGASIGRLGAACDVSACSSMEQAPDLRGGLFYSGARSGNGLLSFVFDGNVYGAIWYTATQDRQPIWYALQGPFDSTSSAGDILRFSNDGTAEQLSVGHERVGNAWVVYASADEIVFYWQFDDGRAGIERLTSVGLPFSQPNRTQLWYTGTESGWGHGVESNLLANGSDHEFWATFLYDEHGEPRWLAGPLDGPDVRLDQYEVHCPGCPYLIDQHETARAAGTLQRAWLGPLDGRIDMSIQFQPPLEGEWARQGAPIIPLGEPSE